MINKLNIPSAGNWIEVENKINEIIKELDAINDRLSKLENKW